MGLLHLQLQYCITPLFFFQPFTSCIVGSVIQRHHNSSNATMDGKSGDRAGFLPGGVMDRGLLPAFMNQVPNYFTLPLRSSAPLDPNVKSFPAGMQDTIWGIPTNLRGQVGLVCLFHETLTAQQVKTLYDGGTLQFSVWACLSAVYNDLEIRAETREIHVNDQGNLRSLGMNHIEWFSVIRTYLHSPSVLNINSLILKGASCCMRFLYIYS